MSNTPQWTEDQLRAIEAKDSDILIAAAAGSGKTTVLVERIMQKILNDGISVDELMIVTFTNASAKDMSLKIEKAIHKYLKADPQNEHLLSQLTKLQDAHISTIHSFCLKLIQTYYYLIDLDPNFQTADSNEVKLILNDSIDTVLNDISGDSLQVDELTKFLSMLNIYANEETLYKIITNGYYHYIAKPDYDEVIEQEIEILQHQPEAYIKQQLEIVNNDLNGQFSILFRLFNQFSQLLMDKQLDVCQHTVNVEESPFKLTDAFISKYERNVSMIQRMFMLYQHNELDYKTVNQYFIDITLRDFTITISKKMTESEEGLAVKEAYGLYKEQLKQIVEQFAAIDYDEHIEYSYDAIDAQIFYLKLIQKVITQYGALKRKNQYIDFNDYEHFALDIIRARHGFVADHYRQQFKEIMVDEYQDTNLMQEAIINELKRYEPYSNVFMVGDVKQSIYRFRQAEPQLFIDKFNKYKEDIDGQLITLSKNFRSNKMVLDFTNMFFEAVMDSSVGEINYDDDQKLYFGKGQSSIEDQPVVLNIITENEQEQVEYDEIVELEAHFIAQNIIDKIKASNGELSYRDFAIIHRKNKDINTYKRIMSEYNLPFYAENVSGYYDAIEVKLVMSILKVIHNPMYDIPLIGILRSYCYYFNEEELAMIRIDSDQSNSRLSFYEQLQYISTSNTHPLQSRCKQVLDDIENLRAYSLKHSMNELLVYIYDYYHLIEKQVGLPNSEQRQANLQGLFERTKQFNEGHNVVIMDFIRYVQRLLDDNIDIGEVSVLRDDADVVKLMTVHKSKGLEFEYVYYCLNYEMMSRVMDNRVILTDETGVTMPAFNQEYLYTFESIQSNAAKLIRKHLSYSEELRLMYVAMTRAKQQLIFVTNESLDEDDLDLESHYRYSVLDQRIASFERLQYKKASDFVYAVFAELYYQANKINRNHDIRYNIEFPKVKAVQPLLKQNQDRDDDMIQEDAWFERIDTPYSSNRLNKPTKISVSDIKATEEDQTIKTYEINQSTEHDQVILKRPKFLSETKQLTRAEYGTLMHKVMQHLPFKDTVDANMVESLVRSLVDDGIITDDEFNIVNMNEIQIFYNSQLYVRILNANEVIEELPFIVNRSHINESIDYPQLEQGMVDVLLVFDDHYEIIDYKTDSVQTNRMKDNLESILKERYTTQLVQYKLALQSILKKRVDAYVYHFSGVEVEINGE